MKKQYFIRITGSVSADSPKEAVEQMLASIENRDAWVEGDTKEKDFVIDAELCDILHEPK